MESGPVFLYWPWESDLPASVIAPVTSPPRPSAPRRLAACLLLGALGVVPLGCGARGGGAQLAVVSVFPQSLPGQGQNQGASPEDAIPLFLNSPISVTFSEDVDPFTVTRDTVRVMRIRDGEPQRVEVAGRRIGRRAVTLDPIWPTRPDLTDGSYQPGALYRLEVAGFPLTNTVESRSGRGVGERFYRYYRAVSRDHGKPGPLLPVGLPHDPFRIAVGNLRLASNARTLRLHFSQPLAPGSVGPASFDVYVPNLDSKPLQVTQTRILREPWPLFQRESGDAQARLAWSHPCSTVEVTLFSGLELRHGMKILVDVRPEGRADSWVRDLRGRAVELQDGWALAAGIVTAGSKVELLKIPAADRETSPFRPPPAGHLGFAVRGGRIQPVSSAAAGDGSLGSFRPRRDCVLEVGATIDAGGRRVQVGAGPLDFTSFEIPAGVTVTLRSGPRRPMDIRVQGHVRIAGRLLLDTPLAREPREFELPEGDLYRRALAEDAFGARILAAGTLEISGAIEHPGLGPAAGTRSALSLVADEILVAGTLPARTLLAAQRWQGITQSPLQLFYRLPEGVPAGCELPAAAWTRWLRVPIDAHGELEVRVEQDDGGAAPVEVELQTARPDPTDSEQPYRDPAGLGEPRRLSARQTLVLEAGSFVRFRLRGAVSPAAIPRLLRIVLLGD